MKNKLLLQELENAKEALEIAIAYIEELEHKVESFEQDYTQTIKSQLQ